MGNHERIDLRIGVSGSIDAAGEVHTAATVHVDPSRLSSPPVVLFAFPGSGYSRGYYDIDVSGYADVAGVEPEAYSEAAYHVARGHVVVACDHLGVGESSLLDREAYTYEHMAAANNATVQAVMRRIEEGTLAAGIPPLRGAVRIGVGQSMGGCFLTALQGIYRPFDGVAFLGWSGLATTLLVPPGMATAESARPREMMRYNFHLEDVPAAIVDADPRGFPRRDADEPCPMWSSRTRPTGPGTSTMLVPGVVAHWASAIDVPVFVGNGERDVCPDPYAEPTAYRGSNDITVYVLRGSAHMHNFATTRRELWERLNGWIGTVAAP